MHIAMIAAMAANRVIGRNNQMPWHLPADLKHFKALTLGKPVIMGRKTFESIGRPLPGRRNIVISRQEASANSQVEWVNSIEQALALVADVPEVMIIGGAEIYRQCLPLAKRLYLTQIELDVAGDAFFPDYLAAAAWHELSNEYFAAGTDNPLAYRFLTLERV
ncbi:dihydrofolate reductase [Alishewanella longhuensis]|uniref:Dihydrofolate reductase n=1 Tax=Alishewanella longhuensis TaxID=1091037 RepID=A0ABQ3L2U2_9ALTE|nr:type 3 dihydrofolate reductase [Alishewanella longhuensis]GHG61200.1 dihydrofolate reductase [Alishewanella longhuensis]